MRRHFILVGDETTAGGKVIEGLASHTYHGRLTAFEGAQISCAGCKSTGVVRCVAPMRPFILSNGKQAALENDLCICKCPTPPKLVASQTTAGMDFEGAAVPRALGPAASATLAGKPAVAGAVAAEPGPAAATAPGTAEQPALRSLRFRALHPETGQPLENRSYIVTREDGGQQHGSTDAQGYTDAILADAPEQVAVHFLFADNAGTPITREDLQP
ncbi:MAG: PAAR domain-containing protein [Pseudomonadota bacterium]